MTASMTPPTAVAIVYRGSTDAAFKAAKNLTGWLKKSKVSVMTAPEQDLIPGTKALKSKKDMDQISLVIVLGGDGTYLRAVRLFESRAVPVLGFNMGSLGFLTHHSADEMQNIVKLSLEKKLQ